MSAAIYRTDNMEAAALQMVERNDRCLILNRYWNPKPIRMRRNDVRSVRGFIGFEKDPRYAEIVGRWQMNRGVLYWTPKRSFGFIPECDAMLVPEVPTQSVFINHLLSVVKSEIIFYKPPNWQLHNEYVKRLFPTSDNLQTILAVLESMVNRDIPDHQQAALDLYGHHDESLAVFEASEIEQITGIDRKQLVKDLEYRQQYIRYHLLAPLIPPDEPAWMETYRIIEEQPAIFREFRYLPFMRIAIGIPKFRSALKGMLLKGNIQSAPDIFIVRDPHKHGRFDVRDAISNAKRGDWYRIMNTVNRAPAYPIRQEWFDHLDEIRSERAERTLSLVQPADIEHQVRSAHPSTLGLLGLKLQAALGD